MKLLSKIAVWSGKIFVAGAVHAAGVLLGAALAGLLALAMPRIPEGIDPVRQSLLLIPAGMAIALGLAAMASGLSGSLWRRWTVLGAFVWVVHGVGNALEAEIFTTLGGLWWTVVSSLPPSFLCALVVALWFAAPSAVDSPTAEKPFFRQWKAGSLVGRVAVAVLAFPFLYFLFGMLIAPIVVPHYDRLEFLAVPPMPTILQVVFVRSVLLLLVSLPVIAAWRGSRAGLILALGLGHFVTVGLAGLLQVTFFPAVLRWTHGVEILADSMFYAWALVALFVPRQRDARRQETAPQERFA